MSIPAERALKISDLSREIEIRLYNALIEYFDGLAANGDYPSVSTGISATIHSCIALAFSVATSGGMGPGDFIKSLQLLLEGIEREYGNASNGTVSIQSASLKDLKSGLN